LEEWREGIIVPIKKGKWEKIEKYRRVTLFSILYKDYVMVLVAERLNEKLEEKRIVPQNQTGFRKGIGTIDNIYVIQF